jgi:hypothetical protein
MDQIVRKFERESGAPPPRPADAEGRRTITLHVEAETVERQLKRAVVTGGSTTAYEAYCDEGPNVGGDNMAPSPLAYFSLGIAF